MPFLDCNRGRRIYRAAMRTDVVGGHVELGIPHEETLFVYFVHFQPDVLPAEVYKRDTLVPCRFFWLTRAGVLRPAVIYARGDTMQSVAIAGYDVDGIQRHLFSSSLARMDLFVPAEAAHLAHGTPQSRSRHLFLSAGLHSLDVARP